MLELTQREVQRLAEHHEPLLRAVVQVAPDPPALLVGGLDGASAGGDDLVGAQAQRALVAAALELRPGAGGEHVHRLQLARRGIERARGDDADVADRAAVRAAQRDRQVAVQRVGAQEAVVRVAQARAAADEQQLVLVGVLARRAGQREDVALAQLHAVGVGAGDRARVAGAVLGQLGDEGDLGVQRAAELFHQAAQEGGADDTRGPGGEAGEEIALAGDLGGGGGHGNPAMLNRRQRPGTVGLARRRVRLPPLML